MVRWQYLRTAALLLVWAALLPLLAGRPQSAAPAAATGSPASSSSVASRLGQVEGKIASLEGNVLKLFGRLAVVSSDLRSIVKMLAPILSPVVSPPGATTVRPPPAATARPPAATVRPPSVPTNCPAGYSRVGDRSRSKLCLSGLSPQPLAYQAAAERCRVTGGRLLQLENNVKFHLVKGLLADDRQLWVGATYLAAGKDFFWVAGGQRVQVKVQGVVTGGATCAVLVMFRTAGHLAAENCRSPRYFVCEKTLP